MPKRNAATAAADATTPPSEDPPLRRANDPATPEEKSAAIAAAPPTPGDAAVASGEPAPGAGAAPDATAEHPALDGQRHGGHHVEQNPTGRRLAFLSLTALGVVYGDIGTSPLYALQECFKPEYGLAPNATNIFGVLSLIVWALVLIVSIKYVVYILRADNRGEGGVLALLALVLQREHRDTDRRRRIVLVALGIFGGAFLYGDGAITPAISVLGAVEGVRIAVPALEHVVVPIAFVIIAALFMVQRFGTARVGGLFGWVMLVWFATIAILGVRGIMLHPQIWGALNPWDAVRFFIDHPKPSFVVLGAVVLVITGGEALYADMGHFGKKPIRLVWFALVLPALLINYFGQGALLLQDPTASDNPFYHLAPRALLIPLVFVATSAAVVASQALISGAFSLTQQAIQLGYCPRLSIIHTSSQQAGQIYIPEINKALAVGTLVLVVAFRSAAALGAAYGVAVTGTMAITTILFHQITRHRWQWPAWKSLSFTAFFLAIDLGFFASNLLKVPHGGWVPLAVAAVLFLMMTTWKKGRMLLQGELRRSTLPLDDFLESIGRSPVHRVEGTAVFMTSDLTGAPVVLMHHLKHNKVLHKQVVLLSITSAEVPETEDDERIAIEKLTHGFYRVRATYGFMETPDVREIMAACAKVGIKTGMNTVSYFLGRERLIVAKKAAMARWRKKLFIFMSRNARSAAEFFGIPPNRAVEMGAQIEF